MISLNWIFFHQLYFSCSTSVLTLKNESYSIRSSPNFTLLTIYQHSPNQSQSSITVSFILNFPLLTTFSCPVFSLLPYFLFQFLLRALSYLIPSLKSFHSISTTSYLLFYLPLIQSWFHLPASIYLLHFHPYTLLACHHYRPTVPSCVSSLLVSPSYYYCFLPYCPCLLPGNLSHSLLPLPLTCIPESLTHPPTYPYSSFSYLPTYLPVIPSVVVQPTNQPTNYLPMYISTYTPTHPPTYLMIQFFLIIS